MPDCGFGDIRQSTQALPKLFWRRIFCRRCVFTQPRWEAAVQWADAGQQDRAGSGPSIRAAKTGRTLPHLTTGMSGRITSNTGASMPRSRRVRILSPQVSRPRSCLAPGMKSGVAIRRTLFRELEAARQNPWAEYSENHTELSAH